MKTVYVDKPSSLGKDSLFSAIQMVVSMAATIVDQLVDSNDQETDVALTSSAVNALRLMKETENTLIIIATFGLTEGEEAEAFARRFPQRVRALSIIPEGKIAFVPSLLMILGEKKENQ